jgi:acetyl-CoA synthetase
LIGFSELNGQFFLPLKKAFIMAYFMSKFVKVKASRYHEAEKGLIVFLYCMPRSPELYMAFVGCAKIGAIFGPLFEAFMEGAVKDRLADSEAVAGVTTPRMENRIPIRELPHLKHIIWVGSQNMMLRLGEVSWEREMAETSYDLEIAWMDQDRIPLKGTLSRPLSH